MKEKIKCYCGHTTTCECGEEPKQEIPQIGTKEFNDLASAYFGGKPKQETLEEVVNNFKKTDVYSNEIKQEQERSYSEEEVIEILLNFRGENPRYIEEWFEQFKNK